MAFDQTTRNRLQSFVSSARNILSQEFTRQLQADYGMDPKQGTVDDLSTLTHLNNSQRRTAQLLRDTLEHYLATTPGKSDKERTKQVLERIIREQAFTVLNRLAALRMAEAREFLIESIGKSQSSKGFQLYRQLAGTSHGETGDAYRNYLFSLFDEFSVDLAVLFDRHSIQGRLFPRESALLELLAEINHQEIDALWAEDETIGWIYQYFNSQEERKKMRAESQAPRNSRELAVRNQFFTPRYVVEFLTDNTLGRIWYEMTQGNTALVDSCSYLVRRPTEVFLQPGEQAPDTESIEDQTLSQEELLRQPVYIPHRKLKDPRSIRMLDPACGSMHFGLYAFDLFEQIYLEAWQLEQEFGPDTFQREANQLALQTSFSSIEEFRTQIPKLIIENNIHGVDIDPRAVQIAGLSLWQRAQRAWQLLEIKPQQRPVIVKSNIVCAEPMPGDKALLQEFTSQLNPPVLGQLLEVIFDKMQLAGEAGTLLKIEEELQIAIKNARNQWQIQSGRNSVNDMFQAELDAATPQQKSGFDLRGIDDATFWDDAEHLILAALSDYAGHAESTSEQKRLFAKDAAQGFAFIDLCLKRFDVVLMNPPFGDSALGAKKYIVNNYSDCFYDVFGAFIKRGSYMLVNEGLLGAITSRTGFYLSRLEGWRKDIVFGSSKMRLMADLGLGVLDDAMVETAAYTLQRNSDSKMSEVCFFGLMEEKDKETKLLDSVKSMSSELVYLASFKALSLLPGIPLSYWATDEKRFLFSHWPSFNDIGGEIKQGLATGDDYRFLRSIWEVPQTNLGFNFRWIPFAKGGEHQKYYYDLDLVVDWSVGAQEAYKIRTTQFPVLLTSNADKYIYRKGLTYPQRTQKGFSVRQLSEYSIFGGKGPAIFPVKEEDLLYFLGLFNSRIAEELIQLLICFGSYNEGYVSKLPIPQANSFQKEIISEITLILAANKWSQGLSNELTPNFISPYIGSLINRDDEVFLISYLECYFLYLYGIGEEPKDNPLNNVVLNTERVVKLNIDPFDELSFFVGLYFKRWTEKDLNLNIDFKNFDPFEKYYFKTEEPSVNNFVFELDDSSNSDFLFDFSTDTEISRLERVKILLESKLGCTINRALYSPNLFFDFHLKKYSKSRRQTPIYWPLQTVSGSYTLWIYYHKLNEQTLYACVNNFIDPKLVTVDQDLNSLKMKHSRSAQDENNLVKLSELEAELKDFRDELLRIAKFWKPNLNDGVQITAAPLWKLFQHNAWQKKLKDTWEKLEEGDYDWAHLACSIWPERVLRKCHQDRSLAIAHDVEDIFWHEVEVPVKRGAKLTGEMKTEWQPKSLTAAELTELINQTITELK
ncbi:BREX-1 system adenine-specific DNA-methyltransferase PglX [Acinetobacter schindleri]|nr:BREX-1 system adenine-specific DNA-methyltransferase PglX [Acinetobacter schindleri]